MGYFTQEEIDSAHSALNQVIEKAPVVVPADPGHRRGCPQKAWVDQATFWKTVVDEWVPGNEKSFKSMAEVLSIKLLLRAWVDLCERLAAEAERKAK